MAYNRAGVINYEGKVMGMTLIGDELFIVRQSPPNVIFKYDIGDRDTVPGKPVELCISRMIYPRGIAAFNTSTCLYMYIIDWHKMFGGRLWRYEYKKGEETKQEDPFATLDIQPFGVSVSQTTNRIFVTCATPLNVFTTRGWVYIYNFFPKGPPISKVELLGLEIPRQSILTSSDKLIVCHGWYRKSHGVTSYTLNGSNELKQLHFYGKFSGGVNGEQEMNRPLSMIQDKDGFILVVDCYNHRIKRLNEDLLFHDHLLTKEITYPRHICQHFNTGRVFIGQYDGNVHIFDALNRPQN